VKQYEAFPDIGLRAAVAHDGKVVAGDWSGVVKVWTPDGKVVATVDSNPPPTADRLKTAEAAIAAAEAKAKQTADALTAAQTRAKQAAGAAAAAAANAAKV